jgi:hypothetical protein
MDGTAVDFSAPGFGTPTDICRLLAETPSFKFDQLIDEHRGSARWVHLSIDNRARRQVLTFKGGKYTPGLGD